MSHRVQLVARTEHYLHKGSQFAHKPALITSGGGQVATHVLFWYKAESALQVVQLSRVNEQVAHTSEHRSHTLEVELAMVVPAGHGDLQVPLNIKNPAEQVLHTVLLKQS